MQVEVQGHLGHLGRCQVEASEEGFIQDLRWEMHVSIRPGQFQPALTKMEVRQVLPPPLHVCSY